MKSHFVICAIEMDQKEERSIIFDDLSGAEKIVVLVERLHKIRETFAKTKPDAVCIVIWPEFGIHNGFESLSITPELVEAFQTKMKEFEKFPNFIVIAGTCLIRETISTSKLNRIAQSYEPLSWLKRNSKTAALELQSHENAVLEYQQESITPDLLTNTCLIFHKGKTTKQNKVAPFQEKDAPLIIEKKESKDSKDNKADIFSDLVKKTIEKKPTVFKPGTDNPSNMMHTFEHPVTKLSFVIGVEICFDHTNGVLKKISHQPPLIHIVLSASCETEEKNFIGKCNVHLDTFQKPVFFIQDNDPNIQFEFYHTDLFQFSLKPACSQSLKLQADSSKEVKQQNHKRKWELITSADDDFISNTKRSRSSPR